MATQNSFRGKCGTEKNVSKADLCFGCAKGPKIPVYQKMWFWLLVSICVWILGAAFFLGDSKGTDMPSESDEEVSLGYIIVDLQTMLDELDVSTASAKEQYQDQYVQFDGEIVILDGDGSYMRVGIVHRNTWDTSTILCVITDQEQKEFAMYASQGDLVTVRGQITRVGKLQGYTLKVHEIE